jgi:hypothetical protein
MSAISVIFSRNGSAKYVTTMKSKSNHSRTFDAVQFNSSRLRGRKELKVSMQSCLSDKSAAVDAHRSTLPPRRDWRSSSPLPKERIVRSTSPSNFQSSCGHTHKMEENRSVSPKACRLEKHGTSMNGRGRHLQEKRSVSPDTHENSTERRSSPPTADRVSKQRTAEHSHPFRQRLKMIQGKRYVSPELNAKIHLPPYCGRVRSSAPNGEAVLDDISMVAIVPTVPFFLGKVNSLSQSAEISDEITLDTRANAPMSIQSNIRTRTSSTMVQTASASIARVHHFITERARSHYMNNVGKDRTSRLREPKDKAKDITRLEKQSSAPQPFVDTPNEQAFPSVDLHKNSHHHSSKESELEREQERRRLVASITSASTANTVQEVRASRFPCHGTYFNLLKQRKPSRGRATREFLILGLADEEEDIDEIPPSLTSEYLGISLLTMDSMESPEKEPGSNERIPTINATSTTNDVLGKILSDESSGVFAKIMKMMDF